MAGPTKRYADMTIEECNVLIIEQSNLAAVATGQQTLLNSVIFLFRNDGLPSNDFLIPYFEANVTHCTEIIATAMSIIRYCEVRIAELTTAGMSLAKVEG